MRSMAQGHILGWMVDSTKDSTLLVKSTGMEFTPGPVESGMKAHGVMVNSTARESKYLLTDTIERVPGTWDNVLNG